MQATRTYLELKDRNQFKAGFGNFPDIAITSAPQPQPELYRMCYRTVGEAFHWRDRWDWTDEEIAAHLGDADHRQNRGETGGVVRAPARRGGRFRGDRVLRDCRHGVWARLREASALQ